MCGKGSNTQTQTQNQTSTTTPDSQALAAYRALMDQARGVAATPWNPSTGQQVADFSQDQQNAFANVRNGIAQPYINNAAQMTMAGAGPVSATIQQYVNPWTSQVVDATQRDFDVQNNRQLSGVVGNARMAGSLGGDREAVAKALTSEAQSRTQAPIIAGLHSQGFNTALNAAQNDAGRSLQGAGIMGNLAQTAYTDTNALLSTGALQQAVEQRRLDAASGNAAAQSAYPFQTTQWLASLYGGLGPLMGSTTTSSGTSTREGPQPNTWSQAAGLGIAALPYLAALAAGGRVPGFAGGGGIGYVPMGAMQQSQGLQPHQQMQFGGGGAEPQKGMADHWREIAETAKGATKGFEGIAGAAKNIGNSLNTTQGPGGWATTVDYGSTGANLWNGISSAFGGFAAGGAIDDTDVGAGDLGGSYDAVPGIAGGLPRGSMPLLDVARDRPMGGEPPAALVPMSETREVGQSAVGAPPEAGIAYAPPPANFMGDANGLNPTGGVAPARPAQAAPAQSSPGILQRFGNWVTSDEGKKFTSAMGAAMMANSGVGGKGTFGVHMGQGLQAGIQAQDSYQKGQREKAIEQAKLDLAAKAHQLRENADQREAAMHPYEKQKIEAGIAAQKAAAEAAKVIQVDPSKLIYDTRTKTWITPPGGNQEELARIAERKYAEGTPTLLNESRASIDSARNMMRTIDEMKSLSQNMFTGALADQQLAAAKIGRALGLDFDATKIANSEQFRAKMQEFVLDAAQKLKPLSNSDVAFVEKGMPALARDPAAIGPMLESLRRIAQRNALIEGYRQEYYAKGRRPDDAAIEARVNKEVPPPSLPSGSTSGGISPPGATQPPSQSAGIAPPPAQPAAAAPPTEADRQKLLAAPDGLVMFKGKPFIKNGTQMTPAPEGSIKRGFFGSIGDANGNPIPSIP